MEWAFLGFGIFLTLLTIVYSYVYGITPTPTSKKVKACIIQILSEHVHHINGTIVDLGSGWGHLVFALARSFPNCRVIGYEISPVPYLFAKFISYYHPGGNLLFERKDFFQVSLNQVSLVVCYLYPKAMEKLKLKFEEEVPPGAFIVSHTFAIPGWIPIKVIHADDLYRTPIYLYQC